MNIPLHPSELTSLVTRINFEIQEQIVDAIAATSGPPNVASWKTVNGEERLEICCETKMIEVRSVVIPVTVIDSNIHAIPLSGARLEIMGAWRIDADHLWLRNHCFGDAGTLVLALASFEPEHIKAAAITLAHTISKYLDVQLETC